VENLCGPPWEKEQKLRSMAGWCLNQLQKTSNEEEKRALALAREVFLVELERLERPSADPPISLWQAGERMDWGKAERELCFILEEEREEQPDLGHRLWSSNPEPVTRAWAYPEKPPLLQQAKLALELRDEIREHVRDYKTACLLARELGKVYGQNLLRYRYWVRVRNYLSRVVIRRFSSEIPGLSRLPLWRIRPEDRVLTPPKSADQEEWDQYLRATVEEPEDLVDVLDAEREAFPEEIPWEDDVHPEEPWKPSKPLAPPRLVFRLPEEETRELIPCRREVVSWSLPSAEVIAWLGNWAL